jgi:hypothetical protein
MSGSNELHISDAAEKTEVTNEPVPRIVKGFVVPDGALRVRVTNEKGKVCWRRIEEIRNTDVIELNPQGQPQWMHNPIGRPAKSAFDAATPPATKVIGDLMRIKQASIRTDPVILAAESTPESPEVLNQVLLAISEEAASLRFERTEAERNGEDSSTLSMRRVIALKAIGDTWIKRMEQIQNRAVDIDSQAFQELFKFISETFARAMVAADVRQELADSVFSNFAKMLDEDWKKEAHSRMTE